MARLDFLWQLQARDEKLDMEALQGSNRLEIVDKDGQRNKTADLISGQLVKRPDRNFGILTKLNS